PHEIPDEVTGRYEGEELARMRARRPTDRRIAHIEKRLDEAVLDGKTTAKEVTEIRVSVGKVESAVSGLGEKLDTALDFIKLSQGEAHKTERARIGSRAKVIVGICTTIGAIAGVIATLVAGGCS